MELIKNMKANKYSQWNKVLENPREQYWFVGVSEEYDF